MRISDISVRFIIDLQSRHVEKVLCLHPSEGGLGFTDHWPSRTDRDMAESVAALVASCLGGACPISEFDEPDNECPLWLYYGDEE